MWQSVCDRVVCNNFLCDNVACDNLCVTELCMCVCDNVGASRELCVTKLCLCVCNIWTDVKLLWLLPFYICRESFYICRGPAHGITTLANEASDVMGSSWRRPTVYLQKSSWTVEHAVLLLHCCRNLESILRFTCIRTFLRFSPKPYRRQYYDFWHIFAEIMSPMNFGSFWEIVAETLFWIFNMLVKTLWNLVKTTFDNIGCPTSFSRSTSCGSFINLTT